MKVGFAENYLDWLFLSYTNLREENKKPIRIA